MFKGFDSKLLEDPSLSGVSLILRFPSDLRRANLCVGVHGTMILCRFPGVNFCGVGLVLVVVFFTGVVEFGAKEPDSFFVGEKQRFLRAWCTGFFAGDLACEFASRVLRATSRLEDMTWRVFSLTPTFLVGIPLPLFLSGPRS